MSITVLSARRLVTNASYQLAFEVLRDGYGGAAVWALVAGALWCLGLALAILGRRSAGGASPSSWSTVGWALLVLVPVLVVVGGVTTYGGDYELRGKLARGEYTVVKGVVTDFVPGDPCCARGRAPESFTVAGRRYEYVAGDLWAVRCARVDRCGSPMYAGESPALR
jgi:hypothetical protein